MCPVPRTYRVAVGIPSVGMNQVQVTIQVNNSSRPPGLVKRRVLPGLAWKADFFFI